MGKSWTGLLIAFQFFTIIPIRKNFPLDDKRLAGAVASLPLVGAFIGGVGSLILWFLHTFTDLSPLFMSLLFFFSFFVMTGGIHLDGWVDMSDGYFSYRERSRRLEIMKDPRVGTFGVVSLLFLLAFKWVFSYEIIEDLSNDTLLLFALVPFLSRLVMGGILLHSPLAKNEGLAALFQQAASKTIWIYYGIYIFLFVLVITLTSVNLIVPIAFLFVGSVVCFVGFYNFCKRAFGGITGDTLGATVEGTEALLWMIIWLLH